MILNIKEITSAVNKISDIVSGERNIPGVMLDIGDNTVSVCYSDGHKAFIEKLDAISEEGDLKTKLVFPYEQLVRAIANCQPSGMIRVSEVHFTVVNNVMRISADQKRMVADGDNEVEVKTATKTMDIPFVIVEETNDQKAKLLNRMNYESIFNVESGDPDVWDRKKLISVLNTMSLEKARNIYFSSKTQNVFVINSAFTCSTLIDGKELPQEKKDEIRGELAEAGQIELYDAKVRENEVIIHKSAVLSTNMAKIISSILSKLPVPKSDEDDKVFLFVGDGFINIFNGDDTIGMYVEQAKGSKVHLGSFDRFVAFDYSKYQMTFLREFLADSIKSAVNSSKNEKTSFTFKDGENGKEIVITSQDSSKSVSDIYNVTMDNCVDATGDIDKAVITISLKSFATMLGQLKSDLVALDISHADGEQVCMRLAELNMDKYSNEYSKTRARIGLASDVPTPDDAKNEIRKKALETCQYSLITLEHR